MSDQEILKALGFDDAPVEEQARLLTRVGQVVELRMSGLIDEMMTEEQKETFTTIQESKTPEEVYNWLGSELTDVQELYNATVNDYVAELVDRNK